MDGKRAEATPPMQARTYPNVPPSTTVLRSDNPSEFTLGISSTEALVACFHVRNICGNRRYQVSGMAQDELLPHGVFRISAQPTSYSTVVTLQGLQPAT